MFCAALGVLCASTTARARSAADLSAHIVIDGRAVEWDALDAVFGACPVPSDTCVQEPANDSAWSALHELEQIYVTWDAAHLYVAVKGTLASHALVLYIDHRAGGLTAATGLEHWRRALVFGPELRPDLFVAIRAGQTTPELWSVGGSEALQRLSPAASRAVAQFDVGSGALEAAIPWSELFPGALVQVNPDSLAPTAPMFVLPAASAAQGLRLAAAIVHADEGWATADAAPDPTEPLPLDARGPVVLDRVARIDWASPGAIPFVRFGFAVQEQTTPRFLPDAPAAPGAVASGGFELELHTFRSGDPEQKPTRLLVPDRSLALECALFVRGTVPDVLYVTSTIYSSRGERVVELLRDEPMTCAAATACGLAPGRWVWDGRDVSGQPVPGGTYVLRTSAGSSPGAASVRVQRTLAVVH